MIVNWEKDVDDNDGRVLMIVATITIREMPQALLSYMNRLIIGAKRFIDLLEQGIFTLTIIKLYRTLKLYIN